MPWQPNSPNTWRLGAKIVSRPMTTLAHHQRVVDEQTDLDAKREKLTAFYSSSVFHGLPESDQSLLLKQGVAMRAYSEILGERIKAFTS